jgi:S1-C subfamily serine protease
VVTITSLFRGSGSGLFGGGGSAAVGAGFVTSPEGYIATNAHVVTDAQEGGGSSVHEASSVYVQFLDRNQVAAKIVGYDLDSDVALLKIDPSGLPDLHPLVMATDEKVQVGQPVAAIGSPFEQTSSLSVGVVSAVDRTIDSLTKFKIDGAIQTDASINPGNSGGPLLDANGQVIGVDEQINSTSGGNEGVGFALPIGIVARSLRELRSSGHVSYAYLGVRTEEVYPQLADRLGIPAKSGALVSAVTPGGPAEQAGLQGSSKTVHFQGSTFRTGGDVIVGVDGHPVVDTSDLSTQIAQRDPGETVSLEIIRDGKRQTVDVKLGARAE